jgi:Cdc6-like AAA superfamily ATPase
MHVVKLNQLSQISRATKEGVDRLHTRQDERERQEEHQTIVNWLTPVDYALKQSDFISQRQAKTGRWLLDSQEFQEWLKADKRTLFCPGIPGAGKTILTSIVVEELNTIFQNDGSVGIAYLYYNIQDENGQKPEDMLASLLKQLVQEQSFVPDCVKSLYNRHKDKRTRPSIDEISNTLCSVTSNYSRVFIIVDAVDECQVKNGWRKEFLTKIFNLQTNHRANLFATSRFIPEIEKQFEGSMRLEIRARKNDVQKYINEHMSRLRPFVSENPLLQDEIKREIVETVDGMYV